MIALQFIDIKDFMYRLLCTDLFDHFLLTEAKISTYADFTIDGRINPDFFDPEDAEYEQTAAAALVPFSLVRPFCFQLMKGTHTPLCFHFVLQLSPQNQQRTVAQSGSGFAPEEICGMFWNLKYSKRQLLCTTGISYHTFTMDKSLEQEWDRLTTVFFKNHKLPFQKL